jgi:hypothetical protein
MLAIEILFTALILLKSQYASKISCVGQTILLTIESAYINVSVATT